MCPAVPLVWALEALMADTNPASLKSFPVEGNWVPFLSGPEAVVPGPRQGASLTWGRATLGQLRQLRRVLCRTGTQSSHTVLHPFQGPCSHREHALGTVQVSRERPV